MATPTLSTHELAGTLGPILVDVRAGGREMPRPAVVIVHGFKGFKDWGMFPPLAERLARAGFVAVSLNLSGSGVDSAGEFSYPERFARDTFSAGLDDVAVVIAALLAGEAGHGTTVEHRIAGSLTRGWDRHPCRRARHPRWCARHLGVDFHG